MHNDTVISIKTLVYPFMKFNDNFYYSLTKSGISANQYVFCSTAPQLT